MSEQDLDNELVRRVQNGDKNAYTFLVRKYQNRLSGLVSRFVSNQGDIDDVVQDAFIKAYRALPNFRGESAFYTWLYRIAVNTAKNYLTAAGRKAEFDAVDAEEAEQFEGNDNLKASDSPERLLLSDEIKKVIFKTIEELPNDLRTAITLRELEGMSYEDIAQIVQCPIGTVRSRIFRAREAIDKAIAPLL